MIHPPKVPLLCLCLLLVGLPVRAVTIDGRVVWDDDITVAETVRIAASGHLRITAGTTVTFTGKGRLLCSGGRFEARGARFEAQGELEGAPRMVFDSARLAVFEDCELRGLVAAADTDHKAALRTTYTPLVLRNCTVEDSSSIVVLLTTEPMFADNRIRGPVGTGVVIWSCDRARITGNHFAAGNRSSCLLYLKQARNSLVAENRFFGADAEMGLYLRYGAEDNQILANSFFRCGTAIRIQGSQVRRNFFVSNLIFKPRCGIMLRDDCGPDNLFMNGVIWGAAGAGLQAGIGAATAPLVVRNTVFAAGRAAVTVGKGAAVPELIGNCFWDNRNQPQPEVAAAIAAGENLIADPLFVDPEAGNFRPQLLSFGHPADSPLPAGGNPAGTAIGLFPGM